MSLESRILDGAENMMKKRGSTPFVECKVEKGWAFIAGDTLVYLVEVEEEVLCKINNETVQYIIFLLQTNKLKNAVVLYDTIAPMAAEIIKMHQIYNIVLFHYKTVLYDPTVHEKVPLHQLMSSEEVSAELPKIELHNLPRISQNDPIVRFYNWPVGRVVRISRKTGPYYRIITED